MLRSKPLFWLRAIPTLLSTQRKVVMQTTRSDCGVASVLTVLNLMGYPTDPVQAMELMDPDRKGSTLDALRRYFVEHQGLAARALKAPTANLHQLNGRVILHMSQMHYVVLLRLGAQGVLVHDPAMGAVYYPIRDFEALYSGVALEISGESVEGHQIIPDIPPERINTRTGFRLEPLGLFLTGVTSRLLECAILLCLVAVLFLVLNHSSFPSLLVAFVVIAVCGGLLLLARQTRYNGEDQWSRRKQAQVWRGVIRNTFRGGDLHGFRGRMERDVSGTVRRGITVNIPQKTQLPAALGSVCIMPLALCLLHPLLGLMHIVLFGILLLVTQLDQVKVCRRSVRGTTGRYSKLTHGNDLLNGVAAPDLMGEIVKWSVIGFAGFSVLLGSLPAVALMFWILAGMQIVPLDFRRVPQLVPGLNAGEAVPGLTGAEVPLRQQKIIGTPQMKVVRSDRTIRIEGLKTLTLSLQQPDLTVREQRLIMADVVSQTLGSLDQEQQVDVGPIRIFGPGQQASQADFEYLMITRETKGTETGETLPVPQQTRALMDLGLTDPMLRDMLSCEVTDFPVFWDVRNQIKIPELAERLDRTGLARAGHLTMNRLTVVERET